MSDEKEKEWRDEFDREKLNGIPPLRESDMWAGYVFACKKRQEECDRLRAENESFKRQIETQGHNMRVFTDEQVKIEKELDQLKKNKQTLKKKY